LSIERQASPLEALKVGKQVPHLTALDPRLRSPGDPASPCLLERALLKNR
jgi:hypothetical protein